MNQVGMNTPVQSKRACVVYDASGRIHLLHNVITFVGGTEPPEAQIEADALQALANSSRPAAGELQVLHIAHDAMVKGIMYRVDVEKRALIRQG